jgi:RHS repeat-associated protein
VNPLTTLRRFLEALPHIALAAALTLAPVYAMADFCAPPAPTPNDTPPQPDNPPSCGRPECKTCTASPCFAKTGVYTTHATDLQIPTNGFPLTVARSYESSRVVDGAMGYGWRSSFGARLYYATYLFAAPSTFWKEAVLVMPDGESYRFREGANGAFTPPAGRRDTLVKAADGTFTLTLQQSNVKYAFAADGALLSIADDYGNALRFTLDATRRISRLDDDSGTGRSVELTWNPSGRLASVQDNGGRMVIYSYASNGTLTGVTNPAGQTTTYTYEQRRFAPQLSSIRDHWNRVLTDITWDSVDRVATYTEDGETYTMTYILADQFGPATTVKTHSKGSQTILYDANGLVTSRGGETTTYNSEGDVLSAGNTSYTYTSGGRIATVTYGTDVTFYYTYDSLYPDKVAKVEPRSTTSQSVYNGNWLGWKYTYYTPSDTAGGALPGALKQVERMAFQHQTQTVLTDGDPVSVYAQYSYDSKGRVTRSWNRTDGETTYSYEDAARTQHTFQAPNVQLGVPRPTTYAFDSVGRTLSVTDPLGNVIAYEYDPLDRVTKVTLPKPSASSTLAFVTTYSYDNAGSNPALTYMHATDPNGRTTKQGYDAFGHLVESVDADGRMTAYGYANGLLTTITDANGNVTSYNYDSMRRLSKTTFADGKAESYAYFADGKLQSKTDRKGVTTAYQYDVYGRMSRQVTGSVTRVINFLGQKLTSISDTDGATTDNIVYSYDPKTFLPTSETQGLGMNTFRGKIEYTWQTSTDLMNSYKVTDGEATGDTQTISYGYFLDSSVDGITWTRGPGTYRYTYNANGQQTRITFPNGQKRNFTYDDQGRLTQLSNMLGTTNLATFDYEYDKDNDTGLFTVLGQRTKVTADVPALSASKTRTEYFYDASSQLIRARTTTPTVTEEAWTYDAIGNRLTQTAGGTTTSYAYVKNGTNPNNSARLATAGTEAASHDFDGNMTALGTMSFTWDPLNRLKSRSVAGTPYTYNFSYDAQDRRTAIDYQSTKFIYQGQNLVATSYRKAGGYYAANYLFGPGIDEPLARVDSTSVTYYSVDGLGSAILVSDDAGTVKNKYAYNAWGEIKTASETLIQPFRYTAREVAVLDPAGFTERQYYYRARYLVPATGRFISEDPLGIDKINALEISIPGVTELRSNAVSHIENLYAYGNNNSTNFTDPSGLTGCNPSQIQTCQTKCNKAGQNYADCTVYQLPCGLFTAQWTWCACHPKNNKCPPCPSQPPQPAEYHHVPNQHGCAAGHWHYYRWNQSPKTCQCFPQRMFGGCL